MAPYKSAKEELGAKFKPEWISLAAEMLSELQTGALTALELFEVPLADARAASLCVQMFARADIFKKEVGFAYYYSQCLMFHSRIEGLVEKAKAEIKRSESASNN